MFIEIEFLLYSRQQTTPISYSFAHWKKSKWLSKFYFEKFSVLFFKFHCATDYIFKFLLLILNYHRNYILYRKNSLNIVFFNRTHIQLPNSRQPQDVTNKLKVLNKSHRYTSCALGMSKSRRSVFRECTVVYSSSNMSNYREEFSTCLLAQYMWQGIFQR